MNGNPILRWPLLALLLSALSLPALRAQSRPSSPDPLMSLMLSQPKIEIATQVVAVASFDPPLVRPGQQSIYRVTFNALEESVEWPEEIASSPKLEMLPGAHGQVFHMNIGRLEPQTTFNSRVRASRPGQYTVPLFMVHVYGQEVAVPPAQLEVVETPSSSAPAAAELSLEFAETNPFVGQAVNLRVVFPAAEGAPVQGLMQVQLNGDGFIVDQSSQRQRFERISHSGSALPAYIYETSLTPIQAGNIAVFAQGFAAGLRSFGPLSMSPAGLPESSLGPPQYSLLESPTVVLQARPLPRDGELPGFTGAIGSLVLGPVTLATNVLRVGDLVKLSVKIANNGSGNLARLVAPPPPHVPGWQLFAENTEAAGGLAIFEYTLVPLAPNARATPAIPFSYFDPKRSQYVDLTIPGVPVTFQPGAAADLSALMQPGSADEAEKEPVLSGLAAGSGWTSSSLTPVQRRVWFPLAQLSPAAAVLALWLWDRRRRYLEQHPEILLRRRARRALRREWRAARRAASAGDAPGFAAAAVSAMRVACAPHYPAEPRALVGGDVLQLLGLPDNSQPSNGSSQIVRRFFAVTDAARFATVSADAAQLLPLQPELDRLLQQLEEKLCP